MTPYQERMKESKQRRSRILRLSKQKNRDGKPLTQQEIADEVQCSRAYVHQIVKAAAKEKQA